jgi:hypothetical protein
MRSILRTQAAIAVAAEKPALVASARVYLPPYELVQRYYIIVSKNERQQRGVTDRSPDETSVRCANDNRKCNGSLLLCLSAGGPNPSQNDTVNGIGTDGKNYHADITSSNIVNSESKYKSKYSKGLGNGDVPGPLVEST